jgi:PAS domain S-box-containing protein
MTSGNPIGSRAGTETDIFRLIVNGIVDYAIFMLSRDGHVASWNAGAERIKGYRAEEIIGRHYSAFYPAEDVAAGIPQEHLRVAVAKGSHEYEGWRIRKDGSRFWANVLITALYDTSGELRGFGKLTRDLTERRAAERTLSERQQILAHLVAAQESERRRISWAIHDDTIQSMVAVGMRLQLLASQLPEQFAPAVRKLDDAVHASISRLRNLVFHVRPPSFDRGGLVEALSSYLTQVTVGTKLSHSIRNDLDHEPYPETAVTAFRIVQEAVTNVFKHAQATTVDVSLRSSHDGLLVRVHDDGVGIRHIGDVDAPHSHFGLIEMRERAEATGGWWTIHSGPEAGTTVEFWLPAAAAVPPAGAAPRPANPGPTPSPRQRHE